MKTQLLKSMPHVPLQKVKPGDAEQNTSESDQVEDRNAVGGQTHNETHMNVVENTEATEDTAATFQYDRHDSVNNSEGLGAISRTKHFFGKVFRNLVVRNKRERESLENVVQLTNYGNNEISESVSEEDFQDKIPLMRRT